MSERPLCVICGCSVATVVLPDGDGACLKCFHDLEEDEREQDELEGEFFDDPDLG